MKKWNHTSTTLHYIIREKFTFFLEGSFKEGLNGKGKSHPRTGHEGPKGE